METDLHVDMWTSCLQAVTLGVPKFGNCLEMYTCPSQSPICAQHVYKFGHSLYTRATAWALLVHWSYCLVTPCTLELLLGHFLYTRATAWPLLVHWSYCLATPCTLELLLGHSLHTRATAWVLFVHILYNKPGHCLYTRGILLLSTLGTLYTELHAWTLRAHSLPTNFPLAWASLVRYLQLWTHRIKNVMVNGQQKNYY